MKTIILFARAPQRGKVKTRLARGIGQDAALGLYVAMLRDTLEKAERLSRVVNGQVVLAYTPCQAMELEAQDGAPSLGQLWGGLSWAQPEGDLGARLHAALEWGFARGSEVVALLGADAPDFEPQALSLGLAQLGGAAQADAVLGPARDGGFWALLCSRPLPRGAFELDWSRDETRAPLQAGLEALGLRVGSGLASAEDVDDLESLERLRQRLRQNPAGAAHTARWMHENGWV